MTRDLKSYIEINRWYMTSREMADELGISFAKVNNILSYNKWQAISATDRMKEYIIANPGEAAEDIAEKFGVTRCNIRLIARALEIKLPTRLILKREASKESRYSATGTIQPLTEWEKKYVEGEVSTPRPPRTRLKEGYTQSGSPYGIADELRKIKTK